MWRDINKPIPEAALPEGLEIRPVEEEHIWPIIYAASEAFQDHWGYRPMTDDEHESWLKDPNCRPELWKVAWDGDQIAGSVQNFTTPKRIKPTTGNAATPKGSAPADPGVNTAWQPPSS